jgi:hypothetical protein
MEQPFGDRSFECQPRSAERCNTLFQSDLNNGRTIVGMDLGKLEANAIDTAYQERVGHLFLILCTNLTSSDTKGNEKTSIDQFTRGLALFRKARDLAQSAAAGSKPK